MPALPWHLEPACVGLQGGFSPWSWLEPAPMASVPSGGHFLTQVFLSQVVSHGCQDGQQRGQENGSTQGQCAVLEKRMCVKFSAWPG